MIQMMLAMALAQDAAREDAVRRLATQKVTVDFEQAKLAEALDFLRDATGLNLVLLPAAAALDAERPVRLKAKELPVKSVLKLLLQNRGLTVSWREGALAVVPLEEVQEAVALKIYDVRSQMVKLRDHAGPRMELVSPTSSAVPNVGITLFELSDPKPIIEADVLIDLVRCNTGGRSWESGKATIDLVNGRLVVNQSPAVQREVEDFLRRLGQYR